MPVSLVPEEITVDLLGDSDYVRGRLELEVVLNNIWGSGLKE